MSVFDIIFIKLYVKYVCLYMNVIRNYSISDPKLVIYIINRKSAHN